MRQEGLIGREYNGQRRFGKSVDVCAEEVCAPSRFAGDRIERAEEVWYECGVCRVGLCAKGDLMCTGGDFCCGKRRLDVAEEVEWDWWSSVGGADLVGVGVVC